MSSPRLPSDCTVQAPSWDEFDRSEELDYNSGSEHEVGDHLFRSINHDFVASSGIGVSANQVLSTINEGRITQSSNSLSYLDQLPNSVYEVGITSSLDDQPYGPSLPPGFSYNSEDDPEDPGDPEDPDETDSQPAMPSMSSIPQLTWSSDLPSSSSQLCSCDSTVQNVLESFAPSLPEDEIKRFRETFLLPPPEPSDSRCSSVSYSLKRILGPSIPDLLPTVANSVNDDEDSRDVYGPSVPHLLNKPSTSSGKDFDVEVPVDDDASGHENDCDNDGIFGPVPPWEQRGNEDDNYTERLIRFEAEQVKKITTNKRPEWMTQPPKHFCVSGIGQRAFSRQCHSSEDSAAKREWTETPSEREKRLALELDLFFFSRILILFNLYHFYELMQEQDGQSTAGPSRFSLEAKHNKDSDAIQAQRAAVFENNRVESLLDAHQRKRKLESGENDVAARRPFDRNKDMDIAGSHFQHHTLSRMGDLSGESIKERCGQLNSRFAPSASRKFL
ncbi:unnamed protein product [Thelazia callipaeda]|uniref:DUF3752 domain-containing protein n=1 Tax=Thelazia callipaeda TaxID=103827 RepID=A0A158RBG9_THECL|nr:unnamed protein product [Thelazia callipaeda]